jgi:hypothetical protein
LILTTGVAAWYFGYFANWLRFLAMAIPVVSLSALIAHVAVEEGMFIKGVEFYAMVSTPVIIGLISTIIKHLSQ